MGCTCIAAHRRLTGEGRTRRGEPREHLHGSAVETWKQQTSRSGITGNADDLRQARHHLRPDETAVACDSAGSCAALRLFEQHVVFTVLAQFESSDTIEVHDGRTMDAAKNIAGSNPVRVPTCCGVTGEFSFPRAGTRSSLPPRSNRSPRFLRTQPAPTLFDDNAIQLSQRMVPSANPLFGAAQRPFEASVVEGLQKVVERSCLECPQSILVVRSHKDDRRRQFGPSSSSTSKPSHSGICTSRKTRSGFVRRISASASAPEPHSLDDFNFRIQAQQHAEDYCGREVHRPQ